DRPRHACPRCGAAREWGREATQQHERHDLFGRGNGELLLPCHDVAAGRSHPHGFAAGDWRDARRRHGGIGDRRDRDAPPFRRRRSVSVLPQFIANGVIAGSVYALIALSFALIFTATRIFHFAHGGVYTLAAFAAYTALVTLKLGIVAAFATAALAAALIGYLINAWLYEPMRAGGVSSFVMMISSFGMLIILTHVAAIGWGSNPVVLSQGGLATIHRLGPVYITGAQLQIVGLAVALGVLLWVFFRYVSLGIAIRALGSDP